MMPQSLDTWKALALLASNDAYALESAGAIGAAIIHDDYRSTPVKLHSWRRLKREGWAEVDPALVGVGGGCVYYRLSETGRRRAAALFSVGSSPEKSEREET